MHQWCEVSTFQSYTQYMRQEWQYTIYCTLHKLTFPSIIAKPTSYQEKNTCIRTMTLTYYVGLAVLFWCDYVPHLFDCVSVYQWLTEKFLPSLCAVSSFTFVCALDMPSYLINTQSLLSAVIATNVDIGVSLQLFPLFGLFADVWLTIYILIQISFVILQQSH